MLTSGPSLQFGGSEQCGTECMQHDSCSWLCTELDDATATMWQSPLELHSNCSKLANLENALVFLYATRPQSSIITSIINLKILLTPVFNQVTFQKSTSLFAAHLSNKQKFALLPFALCNIFKCGSVHCQCRNASSQQQFSCNSYLLANIVQLQEICRRPTDKLLIALWNANMPLRSI